jgi:hypothetical protein
MKKLVEGESSTSVSWMTVYMKNGE